MVAMRYILLATLTLSSYWMGACGFGSNGPITPDDTGCDVMVDASCGSNDGGDGGGSTSDPPPTPPPVPPASAVSAPPAIPPVCLGFKADLELTPEENAEQCGGIVDPTLSDGFLVDADAVVGGIGTITSPFHKLEDALEAVAQEIANGGPRRIVYLVTRDTVYTLNDAFTLPDGIQLYGGFVELTTAQYSRDLTKQSEIASPQLISIVNSVEGELIDTIRWRSHGMVVLNATLTMVRTQLESMDGIIADGVVVALSTPGKVVELNLNETVIKRLDELDVEADAVSAGVYLYSMGDSIVNITNGSTIDVGASSGKSIGLIGFLYLGGNGPQINITDSTILSGTGKASVALLLGDMGEDLPGKIGGDFGVGKVVLERNRIRPGYGEKSIGIGLFNTSAMAMIRNNIIHGGRKGGDDNELSAVAQAYVAEGSQAVLVNNTILDSTIGVTVQRPQVGDTLSLINNLIQTAPNGTGVFVDPSPWGIGKDFVFDEISHNLFARPVGESLVKAYYHPKIGSTISCKEDNCSIEENTITASDTIALSNDNMLRDALFAEDGEHLTVSSPAIDNAKKFAAPDEDFSSGNLDNAKNTRTEQWDIGAFEFIK